VAVTVFGSINMDLVVSTPRLPLAGETLIGRHFTTIPGGKGANQAVAAARLGIPTTLVGRVGGDRFGQTLLDSLNASGVMSDRILIDAESTSGVALITVDDTAENHIIVIPGANGSIEAIADVKRLIDILPNTDVLLLQLEIPLAAVVAAAQAAKQAGVTVILDPAPAHPQLPIELYAAIDILTPNQVEANQLVGFTVNNLETATKAAQQFHQKGVKTVIIKLGKQGAFCSTTKETFVVPAFLVQAVDTVAAGDAFNGGLAAAIAEKQPFQQAVRFATAVAALSVTKAGAQSSMPQRAEVEAFLQKTSKDMD
jgi:ribokinase